MENKSLIGQVEQSQIETWKAEYGSVFYIVADNCVAYFRMGASALVEKLISVKKTEVGEL